MNGLSSNNNGASSLKIATPKNLNTLIDTEDAAATGEGSLSVAPLANKINEVALLHAVREGDLDAVEALLIEGADVNTKDGDGWTALMLATVKGHLEVARPLLHRGADMHAKNNKGWTALRFAVSLNDTEIMRLLLESGADVNDKDNEGNTALMQAAGEKSRESLDLLLSYGADTGIKNHAGETALMIAARHGHSEIVQCLKDAGADSEGRHNTELDGGLFSEGELDRLMEKIDGLVPRTTTTAAPVKSARVQDLVPAGAVTAVAVNNTAAPPDGLERLVAALEALRSGKLVAPQRLSIADLAHKLMLNLVEAAALSGLSRNHLRQAMKEGKLKSRKTGRGWRIKRANLEAYVSKL